MLASRRLASGSLANPLKKVPACRNLWWRRATSGLSLGPCVMTVGFQQNLSTSTLTSGTPFGLRSFNGGLAHLRPLRVLHNVKHDANIIKTQGLTGVVLSGYQVRQYCSDSRDITGSADQGSSTHNHDDAHADEQQREHVFSSGRARDTVDRVDAMSAAHMSLSEIKSSSCQDVGDTSASGITEYNASEQYDSSGTVSLHGVMQSNVPEPFSPNDRGNPTHMNMPGGGQVRQDKYIQGHIKDVHPSRQYSTSTRFMTQSSHHHVTSSSDDFIDSSVQGVQGEDCARYKLWLQNCKNYNFNCEEQLEGIQSGRKTLSQVFNEQEQLMERIVEDFEERKKFSSDSPGIQGVQGGMDIDMNDMRFSGQGPDIQGVQGAIDIDINDTVEKLIRIENPCPQGIQGYECDRFRLWLENCVRYGFVNCNDDLKEMKTGRKTLGQIFAEQDAVIRSIVQQSRKYSTSASSDQHSPQKQKVTEDQVSTESCEPQMSQKDKLKRAVRDYGATVVVFHVGISLMSLGAAYVAVSSGLDVVAVLEKLGVGQAVLESRLATGASTFVVAYAVHKVFAPVRIGITLTATPFIVRKLRQIGFLKAPKVKPS